MIRVCGMWLFATILAVHFSAANIRAFTIVTSPRVEAFQRTVGAVKSAAAAAGVTTRVVETDARNFCALALADDPALILSVGTEAARMSSGCDGPMPRVAALTLGAGKTQRIAPLDVPPEEVMRAARRWFPNRQRIGVILNSTSALYSAQDIEEAARQAGLRPAVVECAGAEDLLPAFRRLAQESDVVWCLPDPRIYTAATLKELVLASLAGKIPLIGFSESFLRSGAALAIYPNFDRVAAHTAECVRLLLAGKPAPAAPPGYFVTGLNRRVLRLLNLQTPVPNSGGAVWIE